MNNAKTTTTTAIVTQSEAIATWTHALETVDGASHTASPPTTTHAQAQNTTTHKHTLAQS